MAFFTQKITQGFRGWRRLLSKRLWLRVLLAFLNVPVQLAFAASVQSIPLAAAPTGLALAPDGSLVASNGRGYTISLIDPNTSAVRELPVGLLPLTPQVDATQGRAFVASSVDPVVTVYNFGSQQIETGLDVAGPATAVALDASAARLYVGVQPNLVQVFDTASLTLVATSEVGWNVNAIAADSARGRAAVLSRDALVTWLNTDGAWLSQRFVGFQTRELVNVSVNGPNKEGDGPDIDMQWRTVNVSSEPSAIAIDSASGWAWVAGELTGQITGTDVDTEHPMVYNVGSKPRALAVHNGQAAVANWGDNTVSLVTLADGTSTKHGVGYAPSAIVVDTNLNRVLIAENIRNSLGVLNLNDLSYERIALGRNPSALVWDAATNRVYVANSGSSSLSIVSLP